MKMCCKLMNLYPKLVKELKNGPNLVSDSNVIGGCSFEWSVIFWWVKIYSSRMRGACTHRSLTGSEDSFDDLGINLEGTR